MAIERNAIDCSAITAFPAADAPSVSLAWTPTEWQIINLHPTEAVDVSFNGVDVHYKLSPGTLAAGVVLRQRQTKLWLRRASSSGSPTGVIIQLVAES